MILTTVMAVSPITEGRKNSQNGISIVAVLFVALLINTLYEDTATIVYTIVVRICEDMLMKFLSIRGNIDWISSMMMVLPDRSE